MAVGVEIALIFIYIIIVILMFLLIPFAWRVYKIEKYIGMRDENGKWKSK